MDLLRKYLLSSVYRSPDDPGAAVADPPVQGENALGDPPAGDPAPEPAGDPEPPGDPAPEPAHGNKGKTPWFLERISAESAARRAAEQRAADAEALAARLQRGAAGDPPAPAPAAAAQDQPDFETAVQTEAARREALRQCDTVASAGFSDFPDWGEKTNILAAVNAATPDFVMDVVAVDPANAHKLLYQLANDPERAARLVAMDPRRRTSELTRMAMTAAPAPAAEPKPAEPKPAPAPKVASRAPAPPPPVTPSTTKVVDWRSDEASDAEFDAGFNQMMDKRAARGGR